MHAIHQPKGIAEGVYFNLSNEDYHADPALSHSGMTKVLVSWQDYWVHSCHNPDRKDYKPTPAMEFGARSGELLLEPDRFHQKYCTLDRNKGNDKGIWLSSAAMRELRTSIDAITSVKVAKEHFEQGYGEVSVFWRDKVTNVMLRARIDYLRTFGAIDFKRIATVDNWGIGRAVKAQGLDIQNYLYLEAIKAARAGINDMSKKVLSIYANSQHVDIEWLNAFANDEDLLFRFLFQRSTAPYIWEFRELEPDVLQEGGNATRKAIERYIDGIKRFGTSAPAMGTGALKTISSFHIPRRDYDYD